MFVIKNNIRIQRLFIPLSTVFREIMAMRASLALPLQCALSWEDGDVFPSFSFVDGFNNVLEASDNFEHFPLVYPKPANRGLYTTSNG